MNLTSTNCLEATGHTLAYFNELTGIKGVYHDFVETEATVYKATLEGGLVTIKILIGDLFISRSIDEKSNRIFNNTMVNLSKKRKNYAVKILNSQIDFAVNNKFTTLLVIAARDDFKDIFGYRIWAKYGYHMDDKQYDDFLKNFLRKHTRLEKSVYELHLSKTGNWFWDYNGESWFGEFNLDDNSFSRTVFEHKKAQYASILGSL